MKLLEQQDNTIDFHGLTLHVNDLCLYNHIAADEDGDVYVYVLMPYKTATAWDPCSIDSTCSPVATVDLEGMDWRDTLMEIPK